MKDFLSNKYLQIALRLIIGGIFVYASIDKISNPGDFAKAVKNYDMLPLNLVNFMAIVIPMVELVAGLMLIFGIYVKGSAASISILLVVFLIALVQALIRGLDINCGCFSLDTTSTKSDIVIRIVEDIFLLIGSLVITFFYKSKSELTKINNGDLNNE